MIDVKFIKTCAIETWKKKTNGAGGYDITLPYAVTIAPASCAIISTGMAVEIPPGYEIEISARSSISMMMIHITGKIDSDYRGEVKLIIWNLSNEPAMFFAGDRIAQATLRKVENINFIQVDKLTPTDRGAGGFGSTGR